ncbi:MAG: ribosome silencing factor [Anaerolineales bacterium]
MVNTLEEKKGEDIVLMDLKGIVPFTDYFVICSGTSERMLRALMKAALDKVREDHQLKTRIEGEVIDGWLLADFGDVILHVFSKVQRDYYSLEDLWKEGKVLLHVQ